MAIVVKNTKITEEIVDEKGNLLGHISYDPKDYNAYKEIMNIMEDIYKLEDSLNKSKNIDIEKMKAAKTDSDFAALRNEFHSMSAALNEGSESVDSIIRRIDTIFGEGTCSIILNGTYNLDLLIPLLENVTPEFEKVHTIKKNAYLQGVKENVME